MCRYYLVTGRVQGVYFRASTLEQAQALGLSGWVRNVATGQVELVACGGQAEIEQLQAWLWEGPPGARVTQVESREYRSAETFDGFAIRR